MERPAMKFLNRLGGNQGKISYLVAGLSHRFARMAHFTNQFLRRFRIFTQMFGGLLKYVQNFADPTLLLALEIGQFADVVAARPQVADNNIELTTNGLVLLTLWTVYNILQAGDELIDLGLAIGTFFEEDAVQGSDSPVDHFTEARQPLACRDAKGLDFCHRFIKSGQHRLKLGGAQANYFGSVGQLGATLTLVLRPCRTAGRRWRHSKRDRCVTEQCGFQISPRRSRNV